jgi:hypothetical protein
MRNCRNRGHILQGLPHTRIVNTVVAVALITSISTLAGSAISQLVSMRARRNDFAMQRQQRQEDFKRSCYIAMSTSSRNYRMELISYLNKLNQRTANEAARNVLEEARQKCLNSIAEVPLVATPEVQSTIDPINDGLSRAYDATNNLEKRKSQLDESFEEVKRSLKELLVQWNPMYEAMRQDLDMH